MSVVERFRRQALLTPEAEAASDASESVTYARLLQRAEAVAAMLRDAGCRPGRPVGLCLSPTVTRLAAMLGVMGAGSPYVPIDPAFPDARVHAIAGAADVACVLVDEATRDRFAGLPYRLVDVSEPAGTGGVLTEPADGDLAYVIFTSGSTGEPKGVAIEHGGVDNLFEALDEILPPPDPAGRWLAAANVCFDLSVVELFWPLTRGVPVVVAALESLAGRTGGGAAFLAGTLTGGRVTHFFTTPSLVQLLLLDRHLAAAIRRLRVLILGAEIVQPDLVAQLRAVPHLFNAYGPTEVTVATTVHECSAGRDTADVPIGRPLRGLAIRVVDDTGAQCPPGMPGELLISGAGLARGYLGDPGLTAARFPVLDDRRWYRSGDLVTVDTDGVVRYHGRIDAQVKVRGARVELGEIEAAIRTVDGVEEAAVFPVQDRTGRVSGLVAVAKSTVPGLTGPVILRRIGQTLPWYAVPQSVTVLADLPLAVSGKLDRRAVQRLLPAR